MDTFDIEQLAAVLCGIGEDYEETSEVEEMLYGKFGITLEQFENIIPLLFKMLNIGVSPLTNSVYCGFSLPGMWVMKKDITNEFIGNLIEWLSEGSHADIKPGGGFQKEITNNGKVEFILQIKKPK